jgi:hypothetical protein
VSRATPRRKRSERVPTPDYVPPRPAPRLPAVDHTILIESSVEFLAGYTAYFDHATRDGFDPVHPQYWRALVMAVLPL